MFIILLFSLIITTKGGGTNPSPPTSNNIKGGTKGNMNTTNIKEQLANKYNDYLERKSLGLDNMTPDIQERSGDTVEDSIYNKLYKNQIEINKLEQRYIKENKEIDITKAAKRLTELNGKIEKTRTALNNFSKNYQEELEKLQDQELSNEHSVMGRIRIINKYNELSEEMENLPTYQNLSMELNDYNVEKYMLEKKVAQFENENKALISEILRHKKREEVESYLESKEV